MHEQKMLFFALQNWHFILKGIKYSVLFDTVLKLFSELKIVPSETFVSVSS